MARFHFQLHLRAGICLTRGSFFGRFSVFFAGGISSSLKYNIDMHSNFKYKRCYIYSILLFAKSPSTFNGNYSTKSSQPTSPAHPPLTVHKWPVGSRPRSCVSTPRTLLWGAHKLQSSDLPPLGPSPAAAYQQ